jgi:beta-xylosidase
MFMLFPKPLKALIEIWRQKQKRRKLAKVRIKKIKELADKIQRSRKIQIIKSHDETKN